CAAGMVLERRETVRSLPSSDRLPVGADAAIVHALRDRGKTSDDRGPVLALVLAAEDLTIGRADVEAEACRGDVDGHRLDVGPPTREAVREILPGLTAIAGAPHAGVRATVLAPPGRRRVRAGGEHDVGLPRQNDQAVRIVDTVVLG